MANFNIIKKNTYLTYDLSYLQHCLPLICILTHSLTHSLIYSLTHSLIDNAVIPFTLFISLEWEQKI